MCARQVDRSRDRLGCAGTAILVGNNGQLWQPMVSWIGLLLYPNLSTHEEIHVLSKRAQKEAHKAVGRTEAE